VADLGNFHATVGCAPSDEMPPTRARFDFLYKVPPGRQPEDGWSREDLEPG
jgi:hypothetical protein